MLGEHFANFFALSVATTESSVSVRSRVTPGMRVDVLKSILLMTLFIITFVCGLIPFALRRAAVNSRTSNSRRRIFADLFSFLSCFGGGVFMATCVLDLLPDTRELIEAGLKQLQTSTTFPLPEFMLAAGFFMMLFVEQIILWIKEQRQEGGGASQPILRQSSDHNGHSHHGHSHDGGVGWLNTIDNSNENDRSIYDPNQRTDQAVSNVEPASGVSAESSPLLDDHSTNDDVHFNPESHSTFRVLILVVALCCHATFEGLALGLQQDAAVAVQIFGALCIHKAVISFSLGIRLVQSRLRRISMVACSFMFALATILGGFIGLAITATLQNSWASMINGVLQGLSCGTFLYITAFEILPHELNDGRHRLVKLIMLLFGFTTICLFVLLYPNA